MRKLEEPSKHPYLLTLLGIESVWKLRDKNVGRKSEFMMTE